MAKILRQNVGGVDFTMAGCALTGVSPTSAADYVKQITLSDGDVIEDGMMMVVTFANGNSAGNAPNTKTIYSSDQVNYFEDDQLTVPFTLAPAGCYEIEYTGTANVYTYTDYPVFQVGSVSGPVCDYRGHLASGDLWEAGDSVQCMLKEGKFLLLGGSGGADIEVYDTVQDAVDDLPNLSEGQYVATKDTGSELSAPVDVVQSGNMHAVSSNAVAEKFVTGKITVDVGAGVQQFHVNFENAYTTKPLIFANIYDSTVYPYTELTGVNIANVTTQGFDLRVHNNFGATLQNISIAWLAIAQ